MVELTAKKITLPKKLIKKAEEAVADSDRFPGIRNVSGLCELALRFLFELDRKYQGIDANVLIEKMAGEKKP